MMTTRDDTRPLEPMADKPALDTSKVAYQLPQPTGMMPDIFAAGALDLDGDERDWVPQSADVLVRFRGDAGTLAVAPG